MKVEQIFVAGSGGQGIMVLGKTLAQAAVEENKQVTGYFSYGAEMRGGTANCTVIISDKEISSPVATNPKTMIIMNNQSFIKFSSKLADDGLLLLNSSLVETGNIPEKSKTIKTPASEIAQELGNIRCANMVILGKYISVKKILSKESVIASIKKIFMTKPGLVELNIKALEQGSLCDE